MDNISLATMGRLVSKYLAHRSDYIQVLDVGSMNVQVGQYETYRKFFTGPGFGYIGLDIEPGDNVDFVAEDPYNWELESEFDLVISGQCLEHVEYPWLTMEQIAKAMKPGALHFNIVPSQGPYHGYPLDTYRYFPDGMTALCKWAGLEVVEIEWRNDSIWHNVVVVARKPEFIKLANGKIQQI